MKQQKIVNRSDKVCCRDIKQVLCSKDKDVHTEKGLSYYRDTVSRITDTGTTLSKDSKFTLRSSRNR